MNILISQKEHEMLQGLAVQQFTIGSRLYGTSGPDSDTDYLCIYNTPVEEACSGLPNMHQFQYKDRDNDIDWNYCSELQFSRNLHSGESTIMADIILFTDYKSDKMLRCRTYKIIKAYIGFARRDLKQYSNRHPEKLFHATRGLYCAEALLKEQLPQLEEVCRRYHAPGDFTALQQKEQELRSLVHFLYGEGSLMPYYVEDCGNSLWQKLLESNNNKEFRY